MRASEWLWYWVTVLVTVLVSGYASVTVIVGDCVNEWLC
jgi:hypothetical protein